MAIYALKKAIDDIEGEKLEAKNEKNTTSGMGGKKSNLQPKKTMQGR
jgi:hypothetical protein